VRREEKILLSSLSAIACTDDVSMTMMFSIGLNDLSGDAALL
jgi:hypothetical protein